MRLIDADKLIKKKQYLFETVSGAFPKSEWFIKVDEIFNAPTIERPHGEWIILSTSPFIRKCSHCKDVRKGGIEVFNFCPNCGARMYPKKED